ncbi:MAG: hypothetical protein PSU94_03315 [Lacunisphaera sp.]|nr:hypothetical protein [Lacunisphaera sp.]
MMTCLWIEADTSLSGPRVARVLDYVAELRAQPMHAAPAHFMASARVPPAAPFWLRSFTMEFSQ